MKLLLFILDDSEGEIMFVFTAILQFGDVWRILVDVYLSIVIAVCLHHHTQQYHDEWGEYDEKLISLWL